MIRVALYTSSGVLTIRLLLLRRLGVVPNLLRTREVVVRCMPRRLADETLIKCVSSFHLNATGLSLLAAAPTNIVK